MRVTAVLFLVGCAASPTSSSDEALSCDVGGTAALGNACVKTDKPPNNQNALPLATTNQNLSGVYANSAWGIRLSSVNGHYEGVVGLEPPITDTYEIYLSSNPPFHVIDIVTGKEILPTCASSISSSECSSLRHVGTYALTQGHEVRLEFGPTTVSYVRLYAQSRVQTPPVCTADQLTEEANACTATSAGDTPLTANSLTTNSYVDRVTLAPGTVYGVSLPAVSGGYGGWVWIDSHDEIELYLGTPNLPMWINGGTAIVECSRYIASTECSKLRRGMRLPAGQYRVEFGPSANSYVRMELRTITAATGTVKLGPPQTYTTDNAADNVSAGDLDGDGVLDLAVSCPDDASGLTFVDVMKNNGAGAFTLKASVRTNDPARTAIADFDGDGVNDIVETDWDGMGPAGAWLLHNAGGFTFTTTAWGNLTDYNPTLSIGDFDEDGTPEVVANWIDSQNTASGLGGFQIVKPASNTIVQAETGFAGDTADAVAGDFNGDGHQDIVTASASTGAAKLYLGNGSGTVTFAADFTLPAGGVRRLYAFDLDRDGKSDLVAVETNGTTISYGTSVGLAAASQTLAVKQRAVAAGDFDHDGRLDLVFGDYLDQTVTFYLATDAGFEPGGTLTASNGGSSLVAADLNGDGLTDLVVPVFEGIEVFVGTP